jgi:hypothetical protein
MRSWKEALDLGWTETVLALFLATIVAAVGVICKS